MKRFGPSLSSSPSRTTPVPSSGALSRPPDAATPAAPKTLDQQWLEILENLSGQMIRATFDHWLKPTQLLEADETHFTTLVQNRFALDWLSHRLADVIRRAIQRVTGRRVNVHFQLAAETTLTFSSAKPSLQFAA